MHHNKSFLMIIPNNDNNIQKYNALRIAFTNRQERNFDMKPISSTLQLYFPCIIRWERKKLPQEKYHPFLYIGFVFLYFVFHFFIAQMSLSVSIRQSILHGIALMITYRMLNELSPDMHLNYFFVMIMTASILSYPDRLYVFGSLFLLFTSRILTRSSGNAVSSCELIFLFFYAFILFVFSSFIYALNLCIALFIDFQFDKKQRKNLLPALLMGLLSCMWFIRMYGIVKTQITWFWIVIVLFTSVLFIFRISILRHILSFDDRNIRLLQPKRIKSANANLIITLLIFTIGYGKASEMAHFWIMMLCISLPYWKDIYKIHSENEPL